MFRIKLKVLPPKEKEPEISVDELPPTVEDDRKHMIDACVVRIIKARRAINHYVLVDELVKMIEDRFVPDLRVVKQRIENLIERDFIERDAHDSNCYKYIA